MTPALRESRLLPRQQSPLDRCRRTLSRNAGHARLLLHYLERAESIKKPFWLVSLRWNGHEKWDLARDELKRAVVLESTGIQWGWQARKSLSLIVRDSKWDKTVALVGELCKNLPPYLPRPVCHLSYYFPDSIEPQQEETSCERPHVDSISPLFGRPLALPAWKRCLDLIVASLLCVLCLPLLLIVACVVKLTSPGPIIFKQHRAGLSGKPFILYKFRTMIPDAESYRCDLADLSQQDGPAFKMSNDPRITNVGRLLRRTSIDEMPQLWNVLKGDMSLVGPRPLPCEESDALQGWQRRRLDVTPGLTCIWQVNGRSRVTFDEWVRMDLEYICTRSLWTDVKLLILTIPAVLSCKGAQ